MLATAIWPVLSVCSAVTVALLTADVLVPEPLDVDAVTVPVTVFITEVGSTIAVAVPFTVVTPVVLVTGTLLTTPVAWLSADITTVYVPLGRNPRGNLPFASGTVERSTAPFCCAETTVLLTASVVVT